MTENIPSAEHEELLARLDSSGSIGDPRVEEAMLAVPRHRFVPDEYQDLSYEDQPVPVSHGQTMSAPHMVAMMSTALQLEPGDNVLEVGTGLGYHAAVLKSIVGPTGKVTSVEYVPELAEAARANLSALELDVDIRTGDGYAGATDAAPFNAILVTCAIPRIPDTLIEQLADGGHFVAPIGFTDCILVVGRKTDGRLHMDERGSCRFVNAQGRLGMESDSSPLA